METEGLEKIRKILLEWDNLKKIAEYRLDTDGIGNRYVLVAVFAEENRISVGTQPVPYSLAWDQDDYFYIALERIGLQDLPGWSTAVYDEEKKLWVDQDTHEILGNDEEVFEDAVYECMDDTEEKINKILQEYEKDN